MSFRQRLERFEWDADRAITALVLSQNGAGPAIDSRHRRPAHLLCLNWGGEAAQHIVQCRDFLRIGSGGGGSGLWGRGVTLEEGADGNFRVVDELCRLAALPQLCLSHDLPVHVRDLGLGQGGVLRVAREVSHTRFWGRGRKKFSRERFVPFPIGSHKISPEGGSAKRFIGREGTTQRETLAGNPSREPLGGKGRETSILPRG